MGHFGSGYRLVVMVYGLLNFKQFFFFQLWLQFELRFVAYLPKNAGKPHFNCQKLEPEVRDQNCNPNLLKLALKPLIKFKRF